MKQVLGRLIDMVMFILLIGGLTYYIFRDITWFDRHYAYQTKRFDDVENILRTVDLNPLRTECRKHAREYYQYSTDKVDFTITNADSTYLATHFPLIHEFMEDRLAKQIVIFGNGSILFTLKYCDRPSCGKTNGGYFGDYVHYLYKNKSPGIFKDSPYTRTKGIQRFGNWTYRICWYMKG
jgi:hypothetical protein